MKLVTSLPRVLFAAAALAAVGARFTTAFIPGSSTKCIIQDVSNSKGGALTASDRRTCRLPPNGIRSTRTSTVLMMGIRSFVKKKILRREDGGSGSNGIEEEEEEEEGADYAAYEEETVVDFDDDENYNDNDDNGDVADSSSPSTGSGGSYYGESVQDRIQRMKTGSMTEEEKKAFLQTALTIRNSSSNSERKRGPPIRQQLPSESDDVTAKKKPTGQKPSPFPSDVLWSTVIGKGGRGGTDSLESSWTRGSGKEFDDAAKQQYLKMVTDPDRFKSYVSTARSPASAGAVSPPPPSPSVAVSPSETDRMRPLPAEEPSAPYPAPSGGQGAGASPGGNSPLPTDLGRRLGAAAMAKERRDDDRRKQVEREREAERRRLEELQRRREEELRRREEEIAARKKAEEEERLRAEEERKRIEAERRKELEAAQDAYWAKKLAEEKAKNEARLSLAQKREREAKEEEEEMERREKEEREVEKEAERQRLREEEWAWEDQHKGEILKEEEKLHDRELTWSITETSTAEASETATMFGVLSEDAPDVSVSSLVWEQERKKAKLNRMMDLQREQLRALNSPLPSPSSNVGMPSPARQHRQSPTPSPGQSLADLTGIINKLDAVRSEPEVAPSPLLPSPQQPFRLSLSEMTRLKKRTQY